MCILNPLIRFHPLRLSNGIRNTKYPIPENMNDVSLQSFAEQFVSNTRRYLFAA
jgi:hypothetical protein